MTDRTKRTIEIYNVCECGKTLHSIAEGIRGTCGSCWFKAMPADTKSAINKMIASAFVKPGMGDTEKDKLIDDAMAKLDRDRKGTT